MTKSGKDPTERIELLRGDGVVSSLAGAFGGGVRETRLTAILGYRVDLEPEKFCRSGDSLHSDDLIDYLLLGQKTIDRLACRCLNR